MAKILYANLQNQKTQFRNHKIESLSDSGRFLALKLLEENVEYAADYFSDENAIVVTPGLLSGTVAPCTGRLTISTKTPFGIRTVNIAGPFSQKLASLGIAGIVIKNSSPERAPSVIKIDQSGASIHSFSQLKFMPVSDAIHFLREKWGTDLAAIGIGPSGEHVMRLASIFGTYPSGEPEFHCVRRAMGDIFGFKGLKAITVSSESDFSAETVDKDVLLQKSKKLSEMIRNHPICGKALPAYGSITLMELLKNKGKLPENEPENEKENKSTPTPKTNKKINHACTTNCVIGCLNRDKSGSGFTFSSPFDSEAFVACQNLFGLKDQQFVIDLNKKCFDLGLDSIEFISSCAILIKINHEKDAKSTLLRLLDEVKNVSPLGRIIGSTSRGIHPLYAEYQIGGMVTQKATIESPNFQIQIPSRLPDTESISDIDYLYSYMLASGNIGLCLFTAFAVLDNPEALTILSEMAEAKIGKKIRPHDIILNGFSLLQKERAFEEKVTRASMLDNIPEFVKVLYRYYGREKA